MSSNPEAMGDPTQGDDATLAAAAHTLRFQPDTYDWALIRYVGTPIGELILLGETGLSLGRSADNLLRLPEAEVSRRHARLELGPAPEGGTQVLLEDLGSTNGTFVNGHRIETAQHPVVLLPGDVVRVGAHAFKLKRLDEMERNYHQAVLTQTTVDSLTGVSNRATVLHTLGKHFELARRHKRPLSLVLCDLDHFKAVNDRFGHGFGDHVLQAFGALCLRRFRGSDHVGRIGGEEFLMVLPDTTGKEAHAVAEDLRTSLEQETIPHETDGGFRATASLGVAELRLSDLDEGAILARADVALYRAKAGGRNRVEFDAELEA